MGQEIANRDHVCLGAGGAVQRPKVNKRDVLRSLADWLLQEMGGLVVGS